MGVGTIINGQKVKHYVLIPSWLGWVLEPFTYRCTPPSGRVLIPSWLGWVLEPVLRAGVVGGEVLIPSWLGWVLERLAELIVYAVCFGLNPFLVRVGVGTFQCAEVKPMLVLIPSWLGWVLERTEKAEPRRSRAS